MFILIKSKKGEENTPKPIFLFCQGSLPIPLIIYEGKESFGTFPFNPDSISKNYHLVIVGKPSIPLIADVNTLQNDFTYLDSTGSLKLTNVNLQISGSLSVDGNTTYNNDLTVGGDMYVSGNFQVLGTGSIINLTGSQVDIGTNKIKIMQFFTILKISLFTKVVWPFSTVFKVSKTIMMLKIF